jgi:ankyrin repeat protein
MNVEYSSTSFMKSIMNGDTVAAKLFVEAGMPLNEEYEIEVGSKEKLTPLILALSHKFGNIEIAHVLLDNGGDVNKYIYPVNAYGQKLDMISYSPLSMAFNNKKFDKPERKKLILKIIDKGANVNVGFEANDKPLNWAVDEGDLEIVKAMLKKGATVSKTVLEDAERARAKPNGNEIYSTIKSASP